MILITFLQIIFRRAAAPALHGRAPFRPNHEDLPFQACHRRARCLQLSLDLWRGGLSPRCSSFCTCNATGSTQQASPFVLGVDVFPIHDRRGVLLRCINVIYGVGSMASMACGACYVADDGVGDVAPANWPAIALMASAGHEPLKSKDAGNKRRRATAGAAARRPRAPSPSTAASPASLA